MTRDIGLGLSDAFDNKSHNETAIQSGAPMSGR